MESQEGNHYELGNDVLDSEVVVVQGDEKSICERAYQNHNRFEQARDALEKEICIVCQLGGVSDRRENPLAPSPPLNAGFWSIPHFAHHY